MTTAWTALAPDELEAAARDVLPSAVFDFVAGGADDEHALAANGAAFDAYRLLPRVLTGHTSADLSTEVAGTSVDAPALIAPMGMQRLVHQRGELATAAAAAAAGIGYMTATGSSHPLEDIAAVAPSARWFQLYFMVDRGITADLLRRAEAAGYRMIVLTVDVPVAGYRRRDLRNAFVPPADVRWANLDPYVGDQEERRRHADDISRVSGTLTWQDLEWLAGQTHLPIMVKGILAPEDANAAIDCGAAGVVVSNHGGRQLGRVAASLDALPAVAEAVADRASIVFDGGVRRPSDAVVARGLGADAVAFGRPVLWALAVGGEEGVTEWLQVFVAELRRTLMLLGSGAFREVGPDVLVCAGPGRMEGGS